MAWRDHRIGDLGGRDEAALAWSSSFCKSRGKSRCKSCAVRTRLGSDSCQFLRVGRSCPRKGFNSPRTCSRGAARILRAAPRRHHDGDHPLRRRQPAPRSGRPSPPWSAAPSRWACRRSSCASPMSARSPAPSTASSSRLPVLYAWMRVEEARAPGRPGSVAALHRAGRRDRPLLRLRPVLLAPRHPQHDGRQRDVLRHHGAGLGGDLRLAGLSAPRVGGGARRARPLPSGRARFDRPVLRHRAGAARRRRAGRGDRDLLRRLFPRGREGARAPPRRPRHVLHELDHRGDPGGRRPRRDGSSRPALPAAQPSGLADPRGARLGQPCRRPRPAGGGARVAAGDVLLARHLPRGAGGGRPRLARACPRR